MLTLARWMHETSVIPFGEEILTQVYIKMHIADIQLLSEGESRLLLENCLDVEVWRRDLKRRGQVHYLHRRTSHSESNTCKVGMSVSPSGTVVPIKAIGMYSKCDLSLVYIYISQIAQK